MILSPSKYVYSLPYNNSIGRQMRLPTASKTPWQLPARIYRSSHARPQLAPLARSFMTTCTLSTTTTATATTTTTSQPQSESGNTSFAMHPKVANYVGTPSFTGPQDAVYAAIRDDNLVALERLIASGSTLGLADADFNQDPGCAAGWGTPLHFASCSGNVDAVRMLLEAGADPTLICMVSFGEGYDASPLYLAIQEGQRTIVKILWDASAKPTPEMERMNPVRYTYPCIAARAGHATIVRDLLSWKDWAQDVKLEALNEATSRWRFTVVDTLLGIVSYEPEDLHNVLHDAVSFRKEYDNELYPEPNPLEYEEQQMLIERLIEAGANPNFYLCNCPPLVCAAAWALDS